MNRPPGPRGADAVRTLARVVSGRPLEACTGLFDRYGDTVYLPVRPWEGLYILSRPEQAEHVLAANQGNYVKPHLPGRRARDHGRGPDVEPGAAVGLPAGAAAA